MGKLDIRLLEQEVCNNTFHCGNGSIERTIYASYLLTILQHAYAYQFSSDGITLGYYMIFFRKIELDSCPPGISDYYSEKMNYCTAVHIDYLAVEEKFQHREIGTNMLGIIINSILRLAEKFPVRLITIDALKEYYNWYKSKGFLSFDKADIDDGKPIIKMYLDCLSIENKERIKKYEEI